MQLISYFLGAKYIIPVCVSANGLGYIHEKELTLKELMCILEIYKNHPLDHYNLTLGIIQKLGININGSTNEAYMQAKPQEIRSFIKCVLREHRKMKQGSSRIGLLKRKNITERSHYTMNRRKNSRISAKSLQCYTC